MKDLPKSDTTNETRLLERARDGDPAALEELLTKQQERVYRFGMQMCRDREDAREVLQDTLLAMARGLRDFRGSSSLSTWLYKVARSFCIKKRRRRSVEASLGQPNEGDTAAAAERVIDPGGTPEEALADARVERALQEAIAELEPLYRETLVLRDIEGLTAPEVAEVLGIGVRAVKSRLHRARLAVRARMVPLLETGGGAGAEATAATSAAGRGNCPDVLTLFTKHLEGEIGPEVCAAMERHLEGCDRCRGACDSFKRVLALCQTAPATPVPPDVQRSVRRALQDFLARGA